MAGGARDYIFKVMKCLYNARRTFVLLLTLTSLYVLSMCISSDHVDGLIYRDSIKMSVPYLTNFTASSLKTKSTWVNNSRYEHAVTIGNQNFNETDIVSNNKMFLFEANLQNGIKQSINSTGLDTFENMTKFKRSGSKAYSWIHAPKHINTTDLKRTDAGNGIEHVIFEEKTSRHFVDKKTINSARLNFLGNVTKYRENGSKEFPGMPDPCAPPRRFTGVEDILCMKPPKFLSEYKNPCWMDKTNFRCLPYFHLIGICKSGTSDFFKRLLLHPDIIPNNGIFGKEVWYWSGRRFDVKDRAGKVKLGMTFTEFTQMFQSTKILNGVDSQGRHNKITGNGDPMDFWNRFREGVTPQNTPGAEEILWTTPYAVRHVNPNVKLLLMLRDPIDRLYAHYFHVSMGNSSESFHRHVIQSIDVWKKCLQEHSIRHCIYSPYMKSKLRTPLYTSFYIVHLREWMKVFPRKQLFVFRNEDYSADIKGTMRRVLEFLNVSAADDTLLNKMKSIPHFYETRGKKRAGPMLNSTRALLVDLYRPYTEELADFLNDERFAFRDRTFRIV